MGRKNCLPLKVQGALQATVHLWAWPYRRPVLLSKKKGTQQGCATGEGALQRGCATGALPLYLAPWSNITHITDITHVMLDTHVTHVYAHSLITVVSAVIDSIDFS